MHNWQHGQLHPTTKLVFVISYQMSPYSVYTDAHMAKKAEYFPKFQVGVSCIHLPSWSGPESAWESGHCQISPWSVNTVSLLGKKPQSWSVLQLSRGPCTHPLTNQSQIRYANVYPRSIFSCIFIWVCVFCCPRMAKPPNFTFLLQILVFHGSGKGPRPGGLGTSPPAKARSCSIFCAFWRQKIAKFA